VKRRRVSIAVDIDLDPVPGFGHEPESMADGIRRIVNAALGHYNPEVTVIDRGGAS
jgi:hypothetical protein